MDANVRIIVTDLVVNCHKVTIVRYQVEIMSYKVTFLRSSPISEIKLQLGETELQLREIKFSKERKESIRNKAELMRCSHNYEKLWDKLKLWQSQLWKLVSFVK